MSKPQIYNVEILEKHLYIIIQVFLVYNGITWYQKKYNIADVSRIQSLLHDTKNAYSIDFAPTIKIRCTSLLIGLYEGDQEDIVRNLTIDKYHSGPSSNKSPTKVGMFWNSNIFMNDIYYTII